MRPLVSVIVPALNEEKYLERCLRSIRDQTFEDFELIVCDNGSTDRTVEVARKYADRVIVERKKGRAHARNRGVKIARGEILMFLDADVMVPPNFLKKAIGLIRGPVIGVTCSLHPLETSKKLFPIVLSNLLVRLSTKLRFPLIPTDCLIVRKDVCESIGGFNERVEREDLDFSLRARRHGIFLYLSDFQAKTSLRRVIKYGWAHEICHALTSDSREILQALGIIKYGSENRQKLIWAKKLHEFDSVNEQKTFHI